MGADSASTCLIGVAEVQQVVVLEARVLDDGLVVQDLAHAIDLVGVHLVLLVRTEAAPGEQVSVGPVLCEGSSEPGARCTRRQGIASSYIL